MNRTHRPRRCAAGSFAAMPLHVGAAAVQRRHATSPTCPTTTHPLRAALAPAVGRGRLRAAPECERCDVTCAWQPSTPFHAQLARAVQTRTLLLGGPPASGVLEVASLRARAAGIKRECLGDSARGTRLVARQVSWRFRMAFFLAAVTSWWGRSFHLPVCPPFGGVAWSVL